MTDLRKIPLPRRDGPVTWPELELVFREILARQDARNPASDFASGVLANADGTVTLGTGALPTGRTVSVAALVDRIGDDGKAQDQRFLPIVNAGNRLSAQTSNPLTSSGSSTTSTINVASHVVQYGFGTVSYNSGTISGLTPSTEYFVYADDDFTGGAVSYAATTTPATVVASNNRYYVGSITTAAATVPGNISAITNANPCVVTVVGHSFNTGNTVTFTGVGGMTELNGNNYTITKLTADTFSLNSTDSTGYGVYTSGGTASRVSTATGGGGGGGWGTLIP